MKISKCFCRKQNKETETRCKRRSQRDQRYTCCHLKYSYLAIYKKLKWSATYLVSNQIFPFLISEYFHNLNNKQEKCSLFIDKEKVELGARNCNIIQGMYLESIHHFGLWGLIGNLLLTSCFCLTFFKDRRTARLCVVFPNTNIFFLLLIS